VTPDTDIVVHVAAAEGSRAVGTILPFDHQPPTDVNEGNLYGVHVKFARKFGRVVSVKVNTLPEAEILVKALTRKPR
jgi:hypothetical protein